MSDPVLVPQGDLEKMAKDMARVVEINERLQRDLRVMKEERDRALAIANNAKLDLERVRKILPTDKMGEQNEGLKSAISEAHRKINTLEKELAAAKADAEAQRRLVAQVNRKFDGIQATFDTLQIARDQAYKDRDQAVGAAQSKEREAVEAFHRVQAEFDAFKKANPSKTASPQAKAVASK